MNLEANIGLSKKTTILFPPDLHTRLAVLSAQRGVSLGDLVRAACERENTVASHPAADNSTIVNVAPVLGTWFPPRARESTGWQRGNTGSPRSGSSSRCPSLLVLRRRWRWSRFQTQLLGWCLPPQTSAMLFARPPLPERNLRRAGKADPGNSRVRRQSSTNRGAVA